MVPSMERPFPSFWVELSVGRRGCHYLYVSICEPNIKRGERSWGLAVFTSHRMFYLFLSSISLCLSPRWVPSLGFELSPISFSFYFFLYARCSFSLWNWGMCVLQLLCQWDVGRVQTGLGWTTWISFSAQVRLDHYTTKNLLFLLTCRSYSSSWRLSLGFMISRDLIQNILNLLFCKC